jgi:hypothetical protein
MKFEDCPHKDQVAYLHTLKALRAMGGQCSHQEWQLAGLPPRKHLEALGLVYSSKGTGGIVVYLSNYVSIDALSAIVESRYAKYPHTRTKPGSSSRGYSGKGSSGKGSSGRREEYNSSNSGYKSHNRGAHDTPPPPPKEEKHTPPPPPPPKEEKHTPPPPPPPKEEKHTPPPPKEEKHTPPPPKEDIEQTLREHVGKVRLNGWETRHKRLYDNLLRLADPEKNSSQNERINALRRILAISEKYRKAA